jgi:glycine/D-amino acid oxidase-like deaminating enzyme
VPDALIIGGGCIGSAAALHLLRARPGSDVVVVEPDPTYSRAATTHATGGVRQLFTRPENIRLSQFTLEVIRDWSAYTGLGEQAPDLAWKQNGYLFVSPPQVTEVFERNYATQTGLGVAAAWLEPERLRERYPFLETRDLGPAVLSPQDGWLDPHSLLQGLRRGARQLGAQYLVDTVIDLTVEGTRVVSVTLESGRALATDAVVNAAGIGAPALAERVGMPLPVDPMPRQEHFVEAAGDYAAMPFIKDPDGLAVRSEGDGLSVGLVDFDTPASLELPRNTGWFEEHVWPALAHRIPGLDQLRLKSTWAGHYDQNRLDGNMIIGNHPGVVDNFFVACGFSGHGLMHAPGVGRALAELVVDGGYSTVDLTNFGYRRVLHDQPYRELGVR